MRNAYIIEIDVTDTSALDMHRKKNSRQNNTEINKENLQIKYEYDYLCPED
jgi:hypothetical protein